MECPASHVVCFLKVKLLNFNVSAAFLERYVMGETLQKETSAAVKHVRLEQFYIENQWKNSALERENTFCKNGPSEHCQGTWIGSWQTNSVECCE